MSHKYQSLKDALIAFRSLFTKKILDPDVVEYSKEFLKTVVNKPVEEWNYNEAFRVHGIIKPFAPKLKLIEFDFSAVPEVIIELKKENAVRDPTDRVVGYNGNSFILKFPYREKLVLAVKELAGAKWNNEAKAWSVPLSSATALKQFALGFNFDIGESAFKMFNNVHNNLDNSYSAEYIELNLPVKKTFYGYQTVGVDYLAKNKWAICADEMRLGKTPQSIGAVLMTDTFPCICIVPKTIRLQWKDEWEGWTGKKAMILSHKNSKQMKNLIESGMIDVVITNFDGIETFFVQEIKEVNVTTGPNAGRKYDMVYTNGLEQLFKSVILDEGHHARNKRTLRYKCIKKMFQDKAVRLILTGTPIVKGPENLAALLELIGRIDDFGGYYKFIQTFTGMDKKFLDQKKDNKKANLQLKELNIKLRSLCFIRRERWQVPNATPDKYRTIQRVEIETRADYDHASFSLQSYLANQGASAEKISSALNAEILVQLGLLKQISAKGKITALKELVEDIMLTNDKVIIGCWFNETVQTYKDALKEYNPVTISGRIDGRDMTDEQINENKWRFNNDEKCRIIVITYGKGSEGHNLGAGDHVILPELGWTWKDQGQIEDRPVVVGKSKDIMVTYLLGKDTVDEDIHRIIMSRKEVSKQATGGKDETDSTYSILMRELREKFAKAQRGSNSGLAGSS